MMTKHFFVKKCFGVTVPLIERPNRTGKLNHDTFLFESDISICTGETCTMLVPGTVDQHCER